MAETRTTVWALREAEEAAAAAAIHMRIKVAAAADMAIPMQVGEVEEEEEEAPTSKATLERGEDCLPAHGQGGRVLACPMDRGRNGSDGIYTYFLLM